MKIDMNMNKELMSVYKNNWIMWVYTGLLLTLISAIILYGYIEPLLYKQLFYIRGTSDQSPAPNNIYRVIDFAPFIWINLVSLGIALSNTFFYIFDIESDKIKAFVGVLTLLLILFFAIDIHEFYIKIQELVRSESTVQNETIINDLINSLSCKIRDLTFVVFAALAIIDIVSSVSYTKELKSTQNKKNKRAIKIKRKYAFLQFFLVDLIVVISLIIFLLYGESVMCNLSYNSLEENIQTNLNIFESGVNGMHIVYSQIVFFLLMVYMNYELSKKPKKK